jgi:hypothetical protein
MFLAYKKRIAGHISHAVDFPVFLNIVNTQDDAKMQFDCLQMAFVPSQRTNKLCTHVQHREGIAAVAIFANRTYFVYMPHRF